MSGHNNSRVAPYIDPYVTPGRVVLEAARGLVHASVAFQSLHAAGSTGAGEEIEMVLLRPLMDAAGRFGLAVAHLGPENLYPDFVLFDPRYGSYHDDPHAIAVDSKAMQAGSEGGSKTFEMGTLQGYGPNARRWAKLPETFASHWFLSVEYTDDLVKEHLGESIVTLDFDRFAIIHRDDGLHTLQRISRADDEVRDYKSTEYPRALASRLRGGALELEFLRLAGNFGISVDAQGRPSASRPSGEAMLQAIPQVFRVIRQYLRGIDPRFEAFKIEDLYYFFANQTPDGKKGVATLGLGRAGRPYRVDWILAYAHATVLGAVAAHLVTDPQYERAGALRSLMRQTIPSSSLQFKGDVARSLRLDADELGLLIPDGLGLNTALRDACDLHLFEPVSAGLSLVDGEPVDDDPLGAQLVLYVIGQIHWLRSGLGQLGPRNGYRSREVSSSEVHPSQVSDAYRSIGLVLERADLQIWLSRRPRAAQLLARKVQEITRAVTDYHFAHWSMLSESLRVSAIRALSAAVRVSQFVLDSSESRDLNVHGLDLALSDTMASLLDAYSDERRASTREALLALIADMLAVGNPLRDTTAPVDRSVREGPSHSVDTKGLTGPSEENTVAPRPSSRNPQTLDVARNTAFARIASLPSEIQALLLCDPGAYHHADTLHVAEASFQHFLEEELRPCSAQRIHNLDNPSLRIFGINGGVLVPTWGASDALISHIRESAARSGGGDDAYVFSEFWKTVLARAGTVEALERVLEIGRGHNQVTLGVPYLPAILALRKPFVALNFIATTKTRGGFDHARACRLLGELGLRLTILGYRAAGENIMRFAGEARDGRRSPPSTFPSFTLGDPQPSRNRNAI